MTDVLRPGTRAGQGPGWLLLACVAVIVLTMADLSLTVGSVPPAAAATEAVAWGGAPWLIAAAILLAAGLVTAWRRPGVSS